MAEMTPCGAMFEVLKRRGGMPNREVAELLLSNRPLSDGRSPHSRITDRTWVSRFVVHAPMGSLQERYFCDWGLGARRLYDRLRSTRRQLTSEQVVELVLDEPERVMEQALEAHRQGTTLYRNALERLSQAPGSSAGERAEVLLVLLVAAGCSGSAARAVAYASEYASSAFGMRAATPAPAVVDLGTPAAEEARPLGLLRVRDGLVDGDPSWVDPAGDGVEVGALALGEGDVTEVGADVSGRHLRLRCENGRWLACDLGSSNGTVLVGGADGAESPLEAGEEVEVHPGDALRLGASTTFVLLEGVPREATA